MTVTRVTPGMVKLVDIKPPKQGAPIQAGPIRRVSPRRSKSFDKTKRNAVVDAPGLRLPIADVGSSYFTSEIQ
ncbi:hypothetical protein BU24DRAFT_422633 [Aaosphaeria arxii CBS 175.79]|uniref:Uncharacterized protein n=1 Tax=Aaosphaeria arxii CBS 175.79 TaxID=1450172 RepID=A0A6A5XTL4_9PLEO|nr:uncharacterized protein BU24DRAFT_422633 [Aaosphaeria arxii CBS 175.79]KAF2016293.1 hypothetical protein BU24DRAFT_422633 [Aaosphaeria arxii CBS 175.79]